MVQTAKHLCTFEEYLVYYNDSDQRYELVDGELVPVPPATGRHGKIGRFLFKQFDGEIERLNLPLVAYYGDVGVRTAEYRSRIPDVMIITKEQEQATLDTSAVVQSAPLLVVEIVSENYATTDYRYKRSEYAVRGIPEYWIVDFDENKVTVLSLIEGFYDEIIFRRNERIISRIFPELMITDDQVLQGQK